MSDELFLGGVSYVASKRAAEESGYAQDYIGQLCRGGLIDAQRVGGLWYVSMSSLTAYKQNSDATKPSQPIGMPISKDPDTLINFDGKDYISASRASKLTGYNQDYVGQLARGGKVLSRQIGNRWYVEREGLLAHKKEKDSLLAAVQAEAVGLRRPMLETERAVKSEPYFSYQHDTRDLVPAPVRSEAVLGKASDESAVVPAYESVVTEIPIRSAVVLPPTRIISEMRIQRTPKKTRTVSISQAAVALTVILVLSYGIVTLKTGSTYAVNSNNVTKSAYAASAIEAFGHFGDIIERWIAPELHYERLLR